tara:strand:+ start:512 stop:1996 length:1485 start_codon:yes stop_codon:yes gene_type:complete
MEKIGDFNMKILTKQTTVWQIEVSLRNNRIIDNKFNFTLLDNLNITNLHLFIKKLIKERNISCNRLNKEIKLGHGYIEEKIRNKKAIRMSIIKKILDKLNYKYRDEDLIKLFMDNNSQFYYFKNGGASKTIKLPYYINEILDIIKFLRPANKKNKVYLLTRDNKLVKKITDFFLVKESKPKEGLYEIDSITLNRFLRYFFRYNKKPLLNFPLSNISFKKIDIIRGVILPLLLTDGSMHKSKYSYYFDFGSVPKNKKLHDIFADSLYFTLNKYPCMYFSPRQDDFSMTSFIPDFKKAEEILNICNTVKTGPASKQNKEDFLTEVQPSIDYLFKCNKETKKMALRLWFCTEGSISLNRARKRDKIRARLNLACAHPKLIAQLETLLSSFNVQMNIVRNNDTWSGYIGLDTTGKNSILNFLRIGGFLSGIYVQNSKYHRGIEKQKLLLAILEYIDGEKKGVYNRDVPIEKVHNEINKIVKMGQFKKPEYYISKHSIN